ncbi:ABC transporter permease [Lewinella sp. JB7]|uniref:ABC transporter permease n=1 Tax=Lewinella sp. JB7 TaxID=2962887 RepID=UPI0020C9EC9D|nr:FtsX-like permease family protein [Lewinella sp. JB7]MCP9234324.1 FtsX-like permease family protein [Lewinella sp. JB7]
MIKNYLTLALKVLRRKPFYTFISLFGISFTLMILMVLTSLFDAGLGKNRPLTKRDYLVVSPMAQRLLTVPDTSLIVDTLSLADGQLRYDTTEEITERTVSNSNGPMSYRFIMDNLADLESAERVAIYNDGSFTDGFIDGRKYTFSSYYTNADYWRVLDFEFLYGGPFTVEDVEAAAAKVVLTDRAAREYFGTLGPELIGREMELGRRTVTVAGIVNRPLADSPMFAGDVYLPLTTIDARALADTDVSGGFSAVFEAATPGGRRAIKEEIDFISANYQFPAESNYNKLEIMNATVVEGYAMATVREQDPRKAMRILFIPLTALILLFVALPLINLINLNVSRVFERRAEIGVRKAFGAGRRDILLQFIFENLVITVIGGMIGLVLAIGLIRYVNANDLLGLTRLSLSYRVVFYYLLVILLFGLLSGLLPAFRVSRTNVATALRG